MPTWVKVRRSRNWYRQRNRTLGPSATPFLGTIDLDLEVNVNAEAGGVQVFEPHGPSLSHVYIYTPDGTLFTDEAIPLNYKIDRAVNQVGTWQCAIPVEGFGDRGDGDEQIAGTVGAGWKVSIVQDDNNPNQSSDAGYLLYQGIIETIEHRITAGGNSMLAMTGSLRDLSMVRAGTRRGYAYEGVLSTVADALASAYNDDELIYPATAATATVKGEFNDLSRYTALVKAATYARYAVRESWTFDRIELTSFDNPPDANIRIKNYVEADDGDRFSAAIENAATGIGLIAGEPTVRYDGSDLVNRIIAYGVDTVADPDGDPGDTIDDDLTLGHATLTAPYTVQSGINPGGETFYFIQDDDSIARYGLIETTLIRTDIRNPNDDTTSRAQAGNVLYMTAVNELIKRRSEKLFFTIGPLANGAHIWALPGDQVWVQYTGTVSTATGALTWLDIHQRMLVVERHDVSHPSGVRRVEYTLAAPVMEFPVPGLPDRIDPFDGSEVPAISLPPIPPLPDLPGLPETGGGLPVADPCCADPTTQAEEGPEDDFVESYPPAPLEGGGGGGSISGVEYFDPYFDPIPDTTKGIFLLLFEGPDSDPVMVSGSDIDITSLVAPVVLNSSTQSYAVGVWETPVTYSYDACCYWVEITGGSPSLTLSDGLGAHAYAVKSSGAVEMIAFDVDTETFSCGEGPGNTTSTSLSLGDLEADTDEVIVAAEQFSPPIEGILYGVKSGPSGFTALENPGGGNYGYYKFGPASSPGFEHVDMTTSRFIRVITGEKIAAGVSVRPA